MVIWIWVDFVFLKVSSIFHSTSPNTATEENGETSMDVDEVESSPDLSQKNDKNGIGSRLDSFKWVALLFCLTSVKKILGVLI